MAVAQDHLYIESLIASGLLRGDVLEAGSRSWQESGGNTQSLFRQHDVSWTGLDIVDGPGVDIVADLSDDGQVAAIDRRWDAVLALNLIEHVYDPAAVMRNLASLVSPGGLLVVVSPAFWELHDYPADYWRPLPDFYEEFARRARMEVVADHFKWLLRDQVFQVADLDEDGQKFVPSRAFASKVWGQDTPRALELAYRLLGRHERLYNFPRMGLAVCLRKARD